ncbi:F0F1 ATP synthase subunit B [Alkalicoccobacillus murimartini]|jgi:F-type H+-transporting ATPase subunit b|uniref:ATP synthase subunit b n=1 Tax=Alkalicoccobacillus murimartini TaxID=171685 RepID=A0ABT9YGP7_9BACI|nr:F0F1 ATP synthase subunit B [Alkalicoccobacillus murimartini]MDQ0207038.1 F-type H+-transporting ATPase subunit b [Alkalicoccobacillus murimartini]
MGGLVIPWGSIAVQLIGFIILLALLSKFALKPLLGVMEQREKLVNDQIDSAERNRKDAEELLNQQREELNNAKKEAQGIIENAKKLGEQQGQDIIKTSREEAGRMKDTAIAEIQNEKDQAVVALREQVASLSVLIAQKVIEKELDEKAQEQLIQDYLKQAGEEL